MMPYSIRPARFEVAVIASLAAIAVTAAVHPVSGAAGSLLASLVPVVAAVWFGGWREAVAVVWVAAFTVQFTPVHTEQSPVAPPWVVAAVWGGVYAAACTIGCLTLRRQELAGAELARGAIRDRFRTLIGTNVVPMFVGTTDGRILEANAAWTRLVGPADRNGLFPRWDGWTDSDAGPPLVSSGCVGVTYSRSGRPDATGHLFLVRAAGDEVCGLYIDQSAGRTAVDALRKEAEGLIAADSRKDNAIAMLAHELRNPLAAIRGGVELIRKVTEPAALDKWCRIIDQQATSLAKFADDLLDAARLSRGKVTIERATIDLTDLVTRAAESARQKMNDLRHEFFVAVPDAPLYVEADAVRVTQVIANLLANAAKYTDAGGTVHLSLERTPESAVIRVRDTGVGIAPDFMPQIWEIFAQGRTGPDSTRGGIGLGLTLVKQLVELHGGTVAAHSDGEGCGSEFVVTLPRTVLSWKSQPRPANTPAPTKSPRRILHVEDNISAAETTAAILRLDGHAVTVVHEGPAAIATATALSPDVILLDISLPGMDGYEISRRLRAAGCAATVIAVTGCATEENHVTGFEAGIDHYLLKPVSFDALRELIARPRPRPGAGVGYERLSSTVTNDTRELVPLAGGTPV